MELERALSGPAGNRALLNFVADRCDLRKDFQFNTRVTGHLRRGDRALAHQTEAGERWTAKYFISLRGMLSAPLTSTFPGQETFKGRVPHRALAEGPGRTGRQARRRRGHRRHRHPGHPDHRRQVGHLKVFLRTPQYIMPMRNPKYGDDGPRQGATRPDSSECASGAAHLRRLRLRFRGARPTDMTPGSAAKLMENLGRRLAEFWVTTFVEMFWSTRR
jgi:acetone monooxygenase